MPGWRPVLGIRGHQLVDKESAVNGKSSFAMAGTVVTLTTALCLGSAPFHAVADDLRDQALAEHNTARARHGAAALTWNDALTASTTEYAKQCKFAHSDHQGQYGENLYASENPDTSVRDATDAWMAEAAGYDYDQPRFSPETGHFTQMVWKATTSVTVAVVNCPAGTIFSQPSVYVVARYAPQGNIAGQFAENVGRPS
ncbi:hypothetical protein BN6_28620 [Saccharothrix espanaensis DSM 44229]|uniref:SCP domain-containing protein n=1 Tax=Saccharothrix espanaensis (strain ATCC 51144 / DSM 44229 / JCM 9112 / NBRC 15066 / NRRL 15764) TaxID=1179773 RepID=K0JVZ6_SACES|nr:hypothetical protein BN6_28620 [Saccharothrix espanaensis DSM 44229]